MSNSILYRAGDEPNEDVWGRYVEAETFDDADVAAKLLEGWVAHPQDVPEDARKTPAKADKKAASE